MPSSIYLRGIVWALLRMGVCGRRRDATKSIWEKRETSEVINFL